MAGLKPAEFWSETPYAINLCIRAAARRREAESDVRMQEYAVLGSWLLNGMRGFSSKRGPAIRPEQLYRSRAAQEQMRAQVEAARERAKARMAEKRKAAGR